MLKRSVSIDDVFIVSAVLVLILLISLVAGLASNTITRNVSEQFRSQELQLVGTLSRQVEFFFTVLAGELDNLAARPEVQAITSVRRDAALALFEQDAARHASSIHAIVRLRANGAPRYAWPPELDDLVRRDQPLDWALSREAARQLIAANRIQFHPTPSRTGLVYLLVAPVETTTGQRELLAFELELTEWLQANIGQIDLGESGQLWVLDGSGRLIYQEVQAPAWADTEQLSMPFLLEAERATLLEYEADDGQRQAAYAPARSFDTTFIVILSRLVSESQAGVRQQLYILFGMTVVAVLLIAGLSGLLGRRIFHDTRRRQQAEQRRRVARVLLDVARAVNSSLDLNEVLDRILIRLSDLLAHDTASILLRTDDGLIAAAYHGPVEGVTRKKVFSLDDLRAANEVFSTGLPVVIGDCLVDPRWEPIESSPIRSWMGVPLRVQDEVVGVLNINSYRRARFKLEDVEVGLLFADQASGAIRNARLHEQRIQQYQEELNNAQAIQTSLLPREPINLPQLEVVGYSIPARTVSGDFYQFLPRLDGRLGVAVGDVTGKGMPAAILMAVMTTALRRELDLQPTVADLFNTLNEALIERMQSRHMHAALVMAVFDPPTRRVELANAGMIQPYLRTDRGDWREVSVGGYPLGATVQWRYACRRFTLAPGAALVLVSDGVVEARNAAGEMFGFERLEALLRSLPRHIKGEEMVARVMGEVHTYLGGQQPQDDMTVVVMRSLEVPVVLPTSKRDTVPTRPSKERILAEKSAAQGESGDAP